jgi:hypothetical protein
MSDEFLIQGDFLTQTSREGIREQESWNIKLRDAIPPCFAKGLTNMINNPNLLIDSIKFIPYSGHSLRDKFLAPVAEQILDIIRKLPIVRARSGNWIHPTRALIVPRQLLFEDKPLFSEREIKHGTNHSYEYVDSAYNTVQTITLLKTLGCQTLDFESVFSTISTANFPFQDKPYTWFASLFQYLNSSERMSKVKARVPSYLKLNDGSWTSAFKSRNIFSPFMSPPDEDIPTLGIAILHDHFYRKIAQTAAAAVFLRNMVQVKELSETEIIRAIIEYHRQTRGYADSSLTVDVCLIHAAYLTRRQHLIQSPDQRQLQEIFHFVDHNKIIVRGAENIILDFEISVNEDTSTTLSQLCKSSTLHFLSKDYSHQVVQFIRNFLEIKLFPPFTEKVMLARLSKRRRLITYESETASSIYTELLAPKRRRDNIILYYLSDLLHAKHLHEIPFGFRDRLGELGFLCENGSLVKLESCFIRTRSLDPFLSSGMNVLAVNSPDHPRWTYLETLRVSLQPNLEVFLQLIRRKKFEVIDHQEINADVVNGIYKDIVLFCNGSPDSENYRSLR